MADLVIGKTTALELPLYASLSLSLCLSLYLSLFPPRSLYHRLILQYVNREGLASTVKGKVEASGELRIALTLLPADAPEDDASAGVKPAHCSFYSSAHMVLAISLIV
jgi:hypothetical protein